EDLRERGFDASPMVASLHKKALWKFADDGNLWDDVKNVGGGLLHSIGDFDQTVGQVPFAFDNALGRAVSAPVTGIGHFIDQHNVRAHPDLVTDDKPASGPQQATSTAPAGDNGV